MGIKVLMYHQIVPDRTQDDEYSWTSTISQLRSQLSLLEKWGYRAISLRDYAGGGVSQSDGKSVILTFDDGYETVCTVALPVLKSFGARATIFVVGDRSIRTNTWDRDKGTGKMRLMSDRNLLELQADGFEIGSHSMTHRDLTRVSCQVAENEIRGSKSRLEDLLQTEVSAFAYQLGSTNGMLEKIVEQSGYAYGCGVYSGPPKFGEDKFNVRRIPITKRTNSLDFALKILTPYEYYAWIRWKSKNKVLSLLGQK